ncbi:MAG: potassium channel family protein, partial [Myxococcales bacterium]
MADPSSSRSGSWLRLQLGGAVLAATAVVGVAGYIIAGWRPLDAVYMVVITLFGVGYGEVRAIESDGLRIFTIVLIVAGCSALIYILGGVFQLITEGELNRALGRRRMTKEIEQLKDHVIVCGFGRIGRALTDALQAGGKPFVVVDREPARLEEAMACGAPVFEGDATSEETLEAVGIARAHTLATVLPSDALNVFITLTARNLNPELQILARG